MPQISHSVLHTGLISALLDTARCSGHKLRESSPSTISCPALSLGCLPWGGHLPLGRASGSGRHRLAPKIPRGGLQAEAGPTSRGARTCGGEPTTPSGLTCQCYIVW